MQWPRAWVWASIVPAILTGAGVVLHHANPSAFPAQARLLSDGVYSEAQASRGERVYRGTCERCHGPTLEGSEMAPPLQGEAFLHGWDGEVLTELMMFLQQTMPEDAPGGLRDEEYRDVLTFLLATNGFPPGDELTMTSMEEVVIEARD